MPRLIDADALEKHLINIANTMQDNGFASYAGAMGEAAAIVRSRPTVEVVRCKDCAHARQIPEHKKPYFADGVMECALGRGDPHHGNSVVWDDDFCSDGVKMDGDEDA